MKKVLVLILVALMCMVSDSSAVMISSFLLISAVISAPCATISATL